MNMILIDLLYFVENLQELTEDTVCNNLWENINRERWNAQNYVQVYLVFRKYSVNFNNKIFVKSQYS